MTEGASYNRFNLRNSWPVWFLLAVFLVLMLFFMTRNVSPPSPPPPSSESSELEESAPSAPGEAESREGPQDESPVFEQPATPVAMKEEGPENLSISLPSPEALTESKKPFTIQVFSFKDKAKAQKAMDNIRQTGFPAYMVLRNLKEKGVWYRVCVGEFDTKEEADQMLAQLKKDYRESFVIAR